MAENEKLEEAKRLYQTANADQRYVLESLFPELKELRDEIIRKKLVDLLYKVYANTNYITCAEHDDFIFWLEKQGEQKSVVIIPKFRIGDNIKTTNEEPLAITKIDDKGYWSEDLFICNFDDADKWELVEQKPAWSEEDETTINNLVWAISNDCIRPQDREDYCDWLKFLRPQNHWKPSDEQINTLRDAIVYVEGCNSNFKGSGSVLGKLYNDLKKLREE